MEFNLKLQELRKSRGLTQEELASALFVSRTAVSKWESGRGYPSIESLKIIAKYFSVTVDELLSGEEMLNVAEEDSKQKENRIRTLVFGLVDVSTLMFLFLPVFGQQADGIIKSLSLISLTQISPILRIVYFFVIGIVVLTGIFTLAFQNINFSLWEKSKYALSLIFSVIGVLIFIFSPNQVYAAALLFVMLVIKVFLLIKKQ